MLGHDKFIRVFNDPEPYVDELHPKRNIPFTDQTLVTNYENATLETLLGRVKKEYPSLDFIAIGPDQSQDFLSDPLISKVYSIVYNICQRCKHAHTHDTYFIDLKSEAHGLEEMYWLKDTGNVALPMHAVNVFNVGYFKGGDLVLFDKGPSYKDAPTVLLPKRVNICQSVYNVVRPFKRAPFVGRLYTITTAKLTDRKNAHREIMAKANSYAPNTIILLNSQMKFLDPNFTLDKKHLTRSAYIGHLESGKTKSYKVYSIHRPSPTQTGYPNMLILDERDSKFSGVRYLTKYEIFRLNNHPKPIYDFLFRCKVQDAYKYIANCRFGGALVPPARVEVLVTRLRLA